MNQKGSKNITLLIIIAVILIAIIALIYFFYKPGETNKNTNVVVKNTNVNKNVNGNANANLNLNANLNVNATVNTNTASDETVSWQTYTSGDGTLSFKYPSSGWYISSESTLTDVYSWVLSNWDQSQVAGRGGLDDAMVKFDFAIYPNSDNKTTENIISCEISEPEYTTLVLCDYTTINGIQYKKVVTDTLVEGSSRDSAIGVVRNDKKYTIIGLVPAGDSQEEGLNILDKILNTIVIK